MCVIPIDEGQYGVDDGGLNDCVARWDQLELLEGVVQAAGCLWSWMASMLGGPRSR